MPPNPAPLLAVAALVWIAPRAFSQSCPLPAPVFAGHSFPAAGGPLDSGDFQLINAFPALSFTDPVFLTFSPDATNRLFVVEQAGRIRVFPNQPDVTQTSVYLDISGSVQSAGSEQGLLGLAFDPDYATNGFFYVNYTAPASGCDAGGAECTKIVRYRVSSGDPNRADSESAFELLEYAQIDDVHNGGMLAFGPDGMLYIASGDGGRYIGFNGQNLSLRLGKLLRIDPDAAPPHIPPDNPFASDPGKAPEIWHYGLRNPWRFSFDRSTGDLWIGDVGQDYWEEIDFLAAGHAGGANFGWGVCEGNHSYGGDCQALQGHIPPVLEYFHQPGTYAAVVGGYVYRGTAAPDLVGSYLYGDFVSGQIFAWDRSSAPVEVGSVGELSSFGEDESGELYALDLVDGQVFRIQHGSGGGAGWPALLSQTALFTDVTTLTPAPGLVEYGVAVPFWSDNAGKRRWIGLPAGTRLGFHSSAVWDVPEGTVLVKHFEVPSGPGQIRRLETRVLLLQPANSGAAARWVGSTYRWNPGQTDAELLVAGLDEPIAIDLGSGPEPQPYHYPASWECLECHNSVAGSVLGLRTEQLNTAFAYPGGLANQLTAWSCAGMLARDPGNPAGHEQLVHPSDAGAGLTARARSWLHVNCSMCHQPQGLAPGGMDLRRYRLLGSMNAISVQPTQGDLGIPDARRIAPGSKERSVLWARVQSAEVGVHMPLQGRAVDPLAVDLLGSWIDALTVLDSDGDGVSDLSDNCPYVANDQTDTGGIGAGSAPDGRGNACQCGDLLHDGRVTISDMLELRRSLAGSSAFPPDLGLCNVFDPQEGARGDCDLLDAVAGSRALASAPPGIAVLCRAAGAAP
jgi:uncharacterized repeat protein (TIGR03806 family)